MQRFAVSILSNIAEGCSRNSEIGYKRFLEIAIGSVFQLETYLIKGFEQGYHSEEIHNSLLEEIYNEQRRINALINRIVGK